MLPLAWGMFAPTSLPAPTTLVVEMTPSTADWLVTAPTLFVMRTEYSPALLTLTGLTVSAEPCAPSITRPLKYHWYVKGVPPLAETLKVAAVPMETDCATGCVGIAGAVAAALITRSMVDAAAPPAFSA